MPSFNSVTLVGNAVRDPELRYTPGGAAVCDLSIAVNRKWKDKKTGSDREEVSFIDCVFWARTAEIVAKYVEKGNPILVHGELIQERWDDPKGGGKRSRLKVQVRQVQFLGGKKGPVEQEEQPQEVSDDIPF